MIAKRPLTAATSSTTNDPATGNNSATATTTVNAAPTVVVAPTTVSVSETGPTSASFNVRLTAVPASNVTLAVSFTASQVQVDTGSGFGGSPQNLTLTPANALAGVNVSVRAVDDAIDEVEPQSTILVTGTTVSVEPAFSGLSVADVTVNITDNDTAGVVVTESAGSTAVAEGGAGDSYTVVLTSEPIANVRIDITFDPAQLTVAGETDGTAQLVFTPANWNLAQAVSVAAVDDPVIEGPHTGTIVQTVSSSDPLYAPINPADVSAAITDNDSPGVFIVQSGGNTAVTEGGATDTYTVALNSQPSANVSIALTGTQLGASPTPLVFTNGNWNVPQIVTVTATDDNVVEGSHNGSVAYGVTSGDSNYNGLAVAATPVTIADNDSATVQFAPPGVSQSEGTSPMVFTVSLTNPVASGVTLLVNSTNGTAGAADFTAISGGSVSFPANSTAAQTVSVTIANEALFEADETFTLSLSGLSAVGNVTLGTATATGTIVNDDAPPTITISSPSQAESTTPMGFVVSLSEASGLPVGFNFATANGSAAAPGDYAAQSGTGSIAAGSLSTTINVPIANDTVPEATETFGLNLSAISNANVTALSGTGTIVDDDVTSVSVNDVSVVEGNSGTTNLNFTVTRSANVGAFTVDYATAAGSAGAADFTATSGTLSFSVGGGLVQTITVPVTGEQLVELDESFTVTLGNLVNATLSAAVADGEGTGSITNDDSATVQFAPTTVSQSEATSPMAFTVTLSNPVQSGVTLTVNSANGTAGAADFTAISNGTVSFPAGSNTAQTVNVTIANDALDEDDEGFSLGLSNLTATGNVTLGAAAANGTIVDDDLPPVMSITSPVQDEGNSGSAPMNFTVSLSAASGRSVSFSAQTADGSATMANNDYVALAATPFTLTAGQTSLTIPVTIVGNTLFEGDESFSLNLSGIVNATPGSLSGTGTIRDDDQQPTTTAITSDTPDPSVVGQAYTVSFNVVAQSTSPAGTVSVSDGSASCNATLVAGSTPTSSASCVLTSTTAGAKILTASYTPATTAFAPSSGTATHQVNPAATAISVSGPARSRINQPVSFSFTLGVTAPGAGTPTGTVTLSSGASSCTATLPATSCNLSFSAVGSRSVSASYAGDGNFAASASSGAGNMQTLVFSLSDLQLTKSVSAAHFETGDLLIYTVELRNLGPDTAAGVRLLDPLPAGLTNVQWTCDASGGGVCPATGGLGAVDVALPPLVNGARLGFTIYGVVDGTPDAIVNTASLQLPADTTVEDPALGNNSATVQSLREALFQDGFEVPEVNAATGSRALQGAPRSAEAPATAFAMLRDSKGLAARVYTRTQAGQAEYLLAVRAADGRLQPGNWSSFPQAPALHWTAAPAADGWELTGAALR